MSSPIWSFTYTNPFHSIIIGTTTTISFFSNSLLIFIVGTTSADNIGAYRYLLVFFSLCNITTTIGHVSFEWYCHMTDAGFYFFPRHAGAIVFGVPIASVFCWMFIVTYYQVFCILAFHFVYRFKIVTRGISRSITDLWKIKHWAAACVIAYLVYVSGFAATVSLTMSPTNQTRNDVPPEVLQTYGVDLKDPRTGFIVMAMRRVDHTTNETYWSAESLIGITNHMILFGGTGAVIVFCIARTTAVLKSADSLLSTGTRRMHRQLFKALLIQTTVPLIFSYSPLGLILLFGGITGISLGSFGNVLFLITAIFPSVDGFFVLFFIVKFRIAVIKLFRLPFKTTGMGSSVEQRGSVTVNVTA